MKVFALSDIHIDYATNQQWLQDLSSWDYQSDVLILAGDVTDDLLLLEWALSCLCTKFRQIMFVPGNHELWVVRDGCGSSIDKFHKVIEVAENCGALCRPADFGSLTIVPLFSWYDLTFGPLSEELKDQWSDFHACSWPPEASLQDIASYFLSHNTERLRAANKVVISFSHFLPYLELMPSYIPAKQRFLYPVLGSTALGAQVALLKPTIHVYGHSHLNQQVEFKGVKYVNNAFGYPAEKIIARKRLLSIYES